MTPTQWEKEDLWNGKGYPIWQPYKDGYQIKTSDPSWNFSDTKGKEIALESPQEFKHTLSTVLNGLTQRGFRLLRFEEEKSNETDSEPGTWDHYLSVAPPWLYLWVKKEN